MQKIISLFQRDYAGDRLVINEVIPGAEWVIAGEGRATVKYDGTCCMVRNGKLFKRYEGKEGGLFPADFEAATGVDPVTKKIQGWVPVGDGPEDQWHCEGLATAREIDNLKPTDGTYELCGPKVQGNPHGFTEHHLVPHGYAYLIAFPRTFDEIKEAFRSETWTDEGVVWHHPDGRMVKIKKRDFWK